MSGNLIEDFKSVYDAGRELSKRSASPSQIVDMLSLKAGDLVVRIASNAAVPATPAGVRYAQAHGLEARREQFMDLSTMLTQAYDLGNAKCCQMGCSWFVLLSL
eukprot:5241229-Amphidinium_carterae.1